MAYSSTVWNDTSGVIVENNSVILDSKEWNGARARMDNVTFSAGDEINFILNLAGVSTGGVVYLQLSDEDTLGKSNDSAFGMYVAFPDRRIDFRSFGKDTGATADYADGDNLAYRINNNFTVDVLKNNSPIYRYPSVYNAKPNTKYYQQLIGVGQGQTHQIEGVYMKKSGIAPTPAPAPEPIPEPAPEPIPETIPVGYHKMPDGSIMKDTDMYVVEDDGRVRMVRLGSVEYTEIRIFPSSVQSIIDRGVARLLTEEERAPAPQTFCVNVYTLDNNGNILSNHYDNISFNDLQKLYDQQLYIITCEQGIIPTENQVRQFYGFIDPVEQETIDTTMVSQSIGSFTLKEGRLQGEILFIANTSFNPFFYNKPITSIVKIQSKSGVDLVVKPNNLNFTQSQRDERIQIDEGVGNFKELIITFYVWRDISNPKAFSEVKQIQIVEEVDPVPDDPDKFQPCPQGFHKDFSGKCVPDDPIGQTPPDKLIDTLKGFLFGTVALSLLARKY